MNLYQSIAQRKSCRKYDMQPLKQEELAAVEEAIRGFEPLDAGLPVQYRFTRKVKGLYHVEAPHYLIISGQGKPGEAENIGFVFEQLVLWFDAMDLGCVWLGESKDAENAGDSRGDVITIAFGRSPESVHRTREEFKRKPIADVTNAPDDICIQAAHLAPSGLNTQPWYFEKQDGKTLVYQKKLGLPVSLLYKHSDTDMGIGLCHYALACKETGKPFHFTRTKELPGKAGYVPFGVLS